MTSSFRAGPRLAQSIAVLAALAAGAALVPAAAFLAAGGVLAVALLAAAEALYLRRLHVRVEHAQSVVVSLGEERALPLHVSHDGRVPLQIAVRNRWPAELGGGSSTARGQCAPGERLALQHRVTGAARGHALLPPPHVSLSRFGLVERLTEAGAPEQLRVLPNLKAVRKLHAQLNSLFLRGLGARMAPRVGQGREFDRLREYVPGDDYRQIAWKASARQRKFILREFRVERSQDVLLCVDRGHRMVARVGPLTRADHAVNAAVLASYVCNRAEDRSGMLSFGASVALGVPQGRGAPHLAAVTRFATDLAPGYEHTDYRALSAHLRRRLRARTLVLMLTVLPERGEHGDLLAAVRMLMPRHLPLLLVLTDPDLAAAAQELPQTQDALYRTLVASELVQGRALLVRELRQLGALVVETTPEDSGVAAVNAYLDVKRRQLL